jgi:hypothetical protein
VSNEQRTESVDAPMGARRLEADDRLPSPPAIRILAADDDLVCIDDACAPADAADAADPAR